MHGWFLSSSTTATWVPFLDVVFFLYIPLFSYGCHTFNIVFGLGIKPGFLANILYCMLEETGKNDAQNEKPTMFWNLQCFMICGKTCASLIHFQIYGIILLLPSFFFLWSAYPVLGIVWCPKETRQKSFPWKLYSMELNEQHKKIFIFIFNV